MAVILRATKGTPLSVNELDTNFSTLLRNARVWDSSKTYEVNDIVLYNDSGYKIYQASNGGLNNIPSVGGTVNGNWTLLPLKATTIDTIANLTVTGNISTGNLTASGNITANNLTVNNNVSITKDLTVQGNLFVSGTATTLQTSNLDVTDLNITLAKGVTSRSSLDAAGLTYGDVTNPPTINFVNASNSITFANVATVIAPNLSVTSAISGASLNISGGIVGGSANIQGATVIGGTLTANSTGVFTGNVTAPYFIGNVQGSINNALTADKWSTARTITLGTDLTGTISIDGSANVTLNADINAQVVGTTELTDLGVTTGKLAALAVTTAKIADLNITTGKINDLAVTAAKLEDYGPGVLTVGGSGNLMTITTDAKGRITSAANIASTTITSVGNLTSLVVTGNANVGGNVNVTANINGANIIASTGIYGTLMTASQTNITAVGSLGSLTVTGAANIGTDLTVTGNLVVNGTQTTLHTTNLDVSDLNITLAKEITTRAALDGAGLTYGNVTNPPTIDFINSSNSITFANVATVITPNLSVTSNITTGNISATNATLNGNTSISGYMDIRPNFETITGNVASFDLTTASSYQLISNSSYTGVLNINVASFTSGVRKEVIFIVDELAATGSGTNDVLINFPAGTLRNSPYGDSYMIQEGESARFIIVTGRAYLIGGEKQPYVIEGGSTATPETNV